MKLFAIDMDGTLLDDNNLISENQTSYLLNLIKNQGHKVVITTGRLIDGVKNLLPEELYNLVYVIGLNGGIILDLDKKPLLINEMEYNRVMSILNDFKSYESNISILNEDSYLRFSLDNNEYMDYEEYLNKVKITRITKDIVRELNVVKTVLFFNPNERNKIDGMLKEFNSQGLNLVYSQPYLLEFLPDLVHKGNALRFLANHLDMDMDDVIAFGDGMNDITMMEVAGTSVAMNNAVEIIKDKSNFITKSNNDDGVMFGIQKLLNEV